MITNNQFRVTIIAIKRPNKRNAGICEVIFVTNAAAVVIEVTKDAFDAFLYLGYYQNTIIQKQIKKEEKNPKIKRNAGI